MTVKVELSSEMLGGTAGHDVGADGGDGEEGEERQGPEGGSLQHVGGNHQGLGRRRGGDQHVEVAARCGGRELFCSKRQKYED